MALTPATVDELEKSYKIWIKAVIEAHGDKVSNLREELVRGSKVTDPIRNLRNESIRHWRDRATIPTDDLGARTKLIEIAENMFSSPPPGANKNKSFTEIVQSLIDIRSSKVRSLTEIGKKLFETGVIAFEPVKVKDIVESKLMLGSALFDGSLPPYCHREIDDLIVESLNMPNRRMVVISGEPKVGKTRSLVHNLKQSNLRNSWVFWLEPRGRSLETLLRALPDSKDKEFVAVLDDLQSFQFDESGEITPALLSELFRKCVVVGTVHKQVLSHWNLLRQDHSLQFSSGIPVAPPIAVQMTISEAALELPSHLDDSEAINAQNVLNLALNQREITNLGATLAASEYLLAKAQNLRDSADAFRLAVFTSLFDARIIWPESFDLDELMALTKFHLEFETNLLWDANAWDAVVKYCTEGLNANSPHAILMRSISDKSSYTLFDPIWETLKPKEWDSRVALQIETNLVELGKKAGRAGYKKEALALCLQSNEDKNAETQSTIGNWYDSLGDKANAKLWYELAAQNGDGNANYNLGNLYLDEGNYDEAMRYWAIALESGVALAANNMGVTYDRRGDTSKALYYFEEANKLGHLLATSNLGYLLLKENRYEDAESYLRLAHEGGSFQGSMNLLTLLSRRGRVEEAKELGNQILKKDQDIDPVSLGIIHVALGEHELAEKYYRRASSSGDSFGSLNLGFLELQRDNLSGAIEHLRSARSLGNYLAPFELACALKLNGDLDEAESIFEDLMEAGHVEATLELGIIYGESEKWERAEAMFLEAHKKGNRVATGNLGLLYWRLEKLKKAEKYLKQACLAGSEFAREILACLLIEVGNFDDAQEIMSDALSSGNPRHMELLGLAYWNLNRTVEAIDLLEKAHLLGNSSATENLIELYRQMGEHKKLGKLVNPLDPNN